MINMDSSNSYFSLVFIYGYVFFLIPIAVYFPPFPLRHSCQKFVYSNDLFKEETLRFIYQINYFSFFNL